MPAGSPLQRRLEEIIRAWAPDVVHTHLRRGTRYVARIGLASTGLPQAVHVATLHLSVNGPHYLQTDGLSASPSGSSTRYRADYRGQVFLVPNSLVPHPRLDAARVRELRASLGRGRRRLPRRRRGSAGAPQGFRPAHPRVRSGRGCRARAPGDRGRRQPSASPRAARDRAGHADRLPPRREGSLPGVRRCSSARRATSPSVAVIIEALDERRTGDRDRRAGPERHRTAVPDRDRAVRGRGAACGCPAAGELPRAA